MKSIILFLLFFLCLISLPEDLLAQNKWQLFHDKFPDTLIADSFVFNYDVGYKKKERFYKDSSYWMPYNLRLDLLPDSLVRQRVPVCKWTRNDTFFYYMVEDVSSWNSGYLFIRLKNQSGFLSITTVFQSMPGDGGQFYEYSILDNSKEKLRLVKRSSLENQHGSSLTRMSIRDTKKTSKYIWNADKNEFIISSRQIKKDIWFFKD